MRVLILMALLSLGLQAQAQWIPKESKEIQVKARVQYLTDLRGYSYFHLDHAKLLSADPSLNEEAIQKLVNNGWGISIRAGENFTLKQHCAEAQMSVKIPVRDILEDGRIYLDTTTEMGYFKCLRRN